MVTFSHFTVPRWFAAEGGFESGDAPARFAAFAARATESLGDLISYATTFNEANIPRVIRQVYRGPGAEARSEEHTSELQSLMRISYAVFCLKKKIKNAQANK